MGYQRNYSKMKIYRTGLIEDEGPARRRMERLVKQHPNLDLVMSLRNGVEAVNKIPDVNPDILLMDIMLGDMTVFDVLNKIKGFVDTRIIFTTAHHDYALKAFEFGALDYLVKPFAQERFNTAIKRILIREEHKNSSIQSHAVNKEGLSTKQNSTIQIPEGNKQHIFNERDIVYIQSDRYYVYINTLEEKRLIRITLKAIESILPGQFLRINKSIIINKDFITLIEFHKNCSNIKMINEQKFSSSKTYDSFVKEAFQKA